MEGEMMGVMTAEDTTHPIDVRTVIRSHLVAIAGVVEQITKQEVEAIEITISTTNLDFSLTLEDVQDD